MPIINNNSKEIHCKIIYCGPEKAGKKSCLNFIRESSVKDKFFYTPITVKKDPQKLLNLHLLKIGKILNFDVSLQIFNIPSLSFEEKLPFFNDVDALVFVANSERQAKIKNNQALDELNQILSLKGKDIFKIPLVLQYNKRDLTHRLPLKEIRADLNRYNNRDFETSVTDSFGVMEAFKFTCRALFISLKLGKLP